MEDIKKLYEWIKDIDSRTEKHLPCCPSNLRSAMIFLSKQRGYSDVAEYINTFKYS